MKSKLPAEEEDHWRRPEFISVNDGGTVVCENRLSCESILSWWGSFRMQIVSSRRSSLSDLIAKGAVLRKGERLRSRFCKFIKGELQSPGSSQSSLQDAHL
jgi:hypothetical protein